MHVPGFKYASEFTYRFVASRRSLAYWISRILIGKRIVPLSYSQLRWLFFRILGVVYFIAILSFMIQMKGLIGSEGILPAREFLEGIMDQIGLKSLWLIPSLFWISASDFSLNLVAILGLLSSLMLLIGYKERMNLVVLFVVYLSFVSVGQVFMSYQWDTFLLEVGFLSILFSLWQPAIWLLRFLLFKFMFLSGIGKLLTGEPVWRDLTALTYHYATQPLPTPIAWYFNNLPVWFHEFSAIIVFAVQLVIPFFIFAPRRLRYAAAFSAIGLEVLILLTGNYNFFNILTIALACLLFDDQLIRAYIPSWLRNYSLKRRRNSFSSYGRTIVGVLAAVLLCVSIFIVFARFTGSLPQPIASVVRIIQPLHIANSYGLFTVMTTSRPEIIIEGSYDKEKWLVYEFRYKPGDINRRLPIVAPHQPRLDWQMWFAALKGNYQNAPSFANFVIKLLEGSSPVVNLLQRNPFPEKPPVFIRAFIYNYTFTTPEERGATRDLWKREQLGVYLPEVSLNSE